MLIRRVSGEDWATAAATIASDSLCPYVRPPQHDIQLKRPLPVLSRRTGRRYTARAYCPCLFPLSLTPTAAELSSLQGTLDVTARSLQGYKRDAELAAEALCEFQKGAPHLDRAMDAALGAIRALKGEAPPPPPPPPPQQQQQQQTRAPPPPGMMPPR
jgi:hypothetical protein